MRLLYLLPVAVLSGAALVAVALYLGLRYLFGEELLP